MVVLIVGGLALERLGSTVFGQGPSKNIVCPESLRASRQVSPCHLCVHGPPPQKAALSSAPESLCYESLDVR